MSSPHLAEQLLLHERVLGGDPVATSDAFELFLPFLVEALMKGGCKDEGDASDCAVDAIYQYLEHAERYDRNKSRLSTFVLNVARRRLIDRQRSGSAGRRRDTTYAEVIELRAAPAEEELDLRAEIAHLLPHIEAALPQIQDRELLRLILLGATVEELADAMRLPGEDRTERSATVKRARDRIIKTIQRAVIK